MSAVPRTSEAPAAPIETAEAAQLFAPLACDRPLLLAVSGGPDSVALLALLAEWVRDGSGPALHAATVDHGLRSESAREAAAVASLCRELDVAHRTLAWDGPKPEAGLQAAARRARYELLTGEARRLDEAAIVTAHTLDDQAETLLMRMAHGSGPSGLAGMRPRSKLGATELLRPLLDIPKARLIATLEARGLSFCIDPSNADTRFERVRWRQLTPLLAQQGLDASRLSLLAQRMARQDEALARSAAAAFELSRRPSPIDDVLRLDVQTLAREPEEIMLRGLSLALAQCGGAAASRPRLERLEACADALRIALAAGLATRRTLSGFILALDTKGILTIRAEGARRRGVHPSTSS